MTTTVILFVAGLVINIIILLVLTLLKTKVKGIDDKIEHNRELQELAMKNEVKTREAECDRQNDIITKMFETMDETAIKVAQLVEKMSGHVTNQRQICKLNHPTQTWYGDERREDERGQ